MRLILLTFMLASSLMSQELKIKANQFHTDEKKGISVFQGKVNMLKASDEINASKITVYTDKERKPTKFIAQGDVSFNLMTKEGAIYKGKAGKVIYKPKDKEYYFYDDVHLLQIGDKKEIIGDEVVLKMTEVKAYAKGVENEPVIMIFNMPEEE